MGYFNELSMTPDSRPFSDEGWSVDDRKGSPLPEGCRIAHYSEAGWSYKTPTHTLWITDAPPCERCAGNHPITACQQPAPTPPAVTKEITYNRDNRDFDCYVTIDGQREYIGSAPTFHDGECQCDEYTIRFYADAHTPETAAQLIMEEVEEEARHEQAAADMGGVWVTDEAMTLPEAIALALTGAVDPVCEHCGATAFVSCGGHLYCKGQWQQGVCKASPGALAAVEEVDPYTAFVAADMAWSAELQRLFGRKAGDARYTSEGRVGSLAPLYAEFARAREAWYAKQEAERAAPAEPPKKPCPNCGKPASRRTPPHDMPYIACTACGAVTPAPAPEDNACVNCGGAHHIQRCPDIGAALMAPSACSSCGDPSPLSPCPACQESEEGRPAILARMTVAALDMD